MTKIFVVIKMYQGIIDDIAVFTDPQEADVEFTNWKRKHVSEEDEEKYGLEYSDIEGSTIFETVLIERKKK